MKKLLAILFILFFVTSCSIPDVSKRGDKVFKDADTITPDAEIASISVHLGPLEEISSWHSSDFLSEAGPMNNLFQGDYSVVKRVSLRPVPSWSSLTTTSKLHDAMIHLFVMHNRKVILKSPIIFGSTIIIADYLGVVTALDMENGYKPKWEFSFTNIFGKRMRTFNQVSISYGSDKVFITSNMGDIFALDAETGKIIWSTRKRTLIRSPLKYHNSTLYGISSIGNFMMINAETGDEIMMTSNVEDKQITMDQPSVLIGNSSAIASYPNGNLIAYDINNGKMRWSHDMSNTPLGDNANSSMSDIDFIPAFFNGMIMSGSISGALHLIREEDGAILWIKDISIASQIAVSEEFAFFIDNNDNLVALHWPSSRVKWATKLPTFMDLYVPKYLNDGSKIKHIPILKKGPLIINNQIAVFTNLGELILISPEDGSIKDMLSIPYDLTNPIIVNGKIYGISRSENKLIVM